MTGTMWHTFMADMLTKRGVAFQQEVKVTPWLPEGWSGTADWLFYDSSSRGWVLGDLKTIKGEGIRWVLRDGAKDAHMWQLSAYWHALVEGGFPMVEGFSILYLPMNDTPDKNDLIEPTIQECAPIDRDLVWGVMEDRWAATRTYLDGLGNDDAVDSGGWVTEALAPEQERVQKVYWDGRAEVFNLKLVPHWSTAYCPFPDELCSCSSQGETKIGSYDLDGVYTPRSGYEDVEALVAPSVKDVTAKREAVL